MSKSHKPNVNQILRGEVAIPMKKALNDYLEGLFDGYEFAYKYPEMFKRMYEMNYKEK